MLNRIEVREVESMLKEKMEELMLDLDDPRIEGIVKRALEEKYQIVFKIYRRFVPPQEGLKYILNRSQKSLK